MSSTVGDNRYSTAVGGTVRGKGRIDAERADRRDESSIGRCTSEHAGTGGALGKLRCVLYGDATDATQEAMDLLSEHAVPYKLTTHHDCLHTPALGTQGGILRGIERIRGFVGEGLD